MAASKSPNYPFLKPGEGDIYSTYKIARRVKDISTGENWQIDSIIQKMEQDESPKIQYHTLANIKDKALFHKELEKAKEDLARRKAQLPQKSLKIFCVHTLDEDGMSWASQMVYDCVDKNKSVSNSSDFQITCFTPEFTEQGIPYVASIIGKNQFLRLLFKAGIGKKKWLSENSKYYLRSLLTLIFAVLGNAIFEAVKPTEGGNINAFRIAVIIAGAAIGFWINIILEKYLIVDPTADTTKRDAGPLNDYLRNGPMDEKLETLARLIVEKLYALPAPRFFIIDNYELLDPFSRKVLDQYLLTWSEKAFGEDRKEYWVIFEPQQGDLFAHKINSGEFRSDKSVNVKLLELELLTKSEKKNLVTMMRLDEMERRINRTTIKAVCREMSGHKWIIDNIKKHAAKHGDEFQARFLLLLSLTSNPHNVEFNLREIKKIFQSERVKESVLQFYFFGKEEQTWPEEYGKLIQELESSSLLGKMVQVKNKGKKKSWQVIAEVSDVLDMTSEFDKLRYCGHIFWALHWYSRMPQHSIQAVWVKKLTYHLCELQLAGIYAFEDRRGRLVSKDRVLQQLIEAYLFAVDGCIRTCLLKHKSGDAYEESSDATRLLNKAYSVVYAFHEKDKAPAFARLLGKCWELYYITMEDGLLELIEKINEELEEQRKKTKPPTSVENLFFESLPLPNGIRRKLIALPYETDSEDRNIYSALEQLTVIRAYWTTIILKPVFQSNTVKTYNDSLNEGSNLWRSCFEGARDRIAAASHAKYCMVDLMNISYNLWAFTAYYDMYRYYEWMPHFTQSVKSAMQVLTHPKLSKQASREGEYFISSQLVETCIFCYCSTITYLHIYKDHILALSAGDSSILLADVNEIIGYMELFLGTKLNPLKNLEEIFEDKQVERIDTFLELSCMIWKRLQLDEMYNMVTVRRIHFNTICTANKMNKKFYLSGIVGSTVSENIYSRFLINISKVIYKRDSIELRFKFIADAGKLMKTSEYSFGKLLRDHIFITAFLNPSAINKAFEDFYEDVLKNSRQESPMDKFLDATPGSNLTGAINSLYTTRKFMTDILRQTELDNLVTRFIARIDDEVLRKEITDQVKFHNFAAQADLLKKVDTYTELENWNGYKDKWYYPAILMKCLDFGLHLPELETECASMLSHEPTEDTFNSNLFLALTFIQQSFEKDKVFKQENIAVAEKYMRSAIEAFSDINPAYINLEVYHLLEKLNNENRAHYRERKQYWQEYIEEINALEHLIYHLSERRFCVIFLRITEQLAPFGLNIADGTHGPTEIPPAFFEINGHENVNFQFLEICKEVVQNDNLQYEIQEAANKMAKENLSRLIDTGFELDGLPRQMKAILNEYRDQIDEFDFEIENEESQ